jgi:hypothetical protein
MNSVPEKYVVSPTSENRTLVDSLAEMLALIPADRATDPAYVRSVFHDVFEVDLEQARRDERARVEAERDDLWRSWAAAMTGDALVAVEPEGPEARRRAGQRLMSAEAACRRDAVAWERAFVARAHSTDVRDRTDTQHSTVRLYPRRADAA